MKFTETQLETAIIELLGNVGYPHVLGATIDREPEEVLIKDDLRAFLSAKYAADNITPGEIESVIRKLVDYSPADLYESNNAIMNGAEGRESFPSHAAESPAAYQTSCNIFKLVNQLAIYGKTKTNPRRHSVHQRPSAGGVRIQKRDPRRCHDP